MAVNEPQVFGYLLVFSRTGEEISHVFGIGKEEVKIGRGRDNDIRLNAKLYSRYHVTLRVAEDEDGELRVELVNESKQQNATKLQLPRSQLTKALPQGIPITIDNLSVFFLQGRGFKWKENCEDAEESIREQFRDQIVYIFGMSSLENDVAESEAEGQLASPDGQGPSDTQQIDFEQSELDETIDQLHSQATTMVGDSETICGVVGGVGRTSEAGGSKGLGKQASRRAGSVFEDSEPDEGRQDELESQGASDKEVVDVIGNAGVGEGGSSELGGSQTTNPVPSPARKLIRPLRVSQIIDSERGLGSPAPKKNSEAGRTSKTRGSLKPSTPKRRSSRRVTGSNNLVRGESPETQSATTMECSDAIASSTLDGTSELGGSQPTDPLLTPSPARKRGRPRRESQLISPEREGEGSQESQTTAAEKFSDTVGTSELVGLEATDSLPSPSTPVRKRGRPRRASQLIDSESDGDGSLESPATTTTKRNSDAGGSSELGESETLNPLPSPATPVRKRGLSGRVSQLNSSEQVGDGSLEPQASNAEGTSELGGLQTPDPVSSPARKQRRSRRATHTQPATAMAVMEDAGAGGTSEVGESETLNPLPSPATPVRKRGRSGRVSQLISSEQVGDGSQATTSKNKKSDAGGNSELGGLETEPPMTPVRKRGRASQLFNPEQEMSESTSAATTATKDSGVGGASELGGLGTPDPVSSPAGKQRRSRRATQPEIPLESKAMDDEGAGDTSDPSPGPSPTARKRGRSGRASQLISSEQDGNGSLEAQVTPAAKKSLVAGGLETRNPLPSPTQKRRRASQLSNPGPEMPVKSTATTVMKDSGVGGASELGGSATSNLLSSPVTQTRKLGRPPRRRRRASQLVNSEQDGNESVESEATTAKAKKKKYSDAGETSGLGPSETTDSFPAPIVPARKRGRRGRVSPPRDGSPEPEPQATATIATKDSEAGGTSGPKDPTRGRRRRAPSAINSGHKAQTEEEMPAPDPNSTRLSRYGRTLRPVKRLSYK